MKTTYLLICTLIATQTAWAKPSEKLGPPIIIVADGTSTVTASNVLTEDCDQPPVFPGPESVYQSAG